MLYLNADDIKEVVSLEEMMDCIERAYTIYKSGHFQMPDRMHVKREEGTTLYMPCFTETYSGTKIVSTYPDNIKKNIATIQGTMILNNSETGEILSIMNGAAITAYRTGAVGGVGIRYTTRSNCQSVGLIGKGVQGYYQLLYACAARDIKNIYIFGTATEKANKFKQKLEDALQGIHIHLESNLNTLIEKSDILITATPSEKPVLPNDVTHLKGKHVIAIGSYQLKMRELPRALYEVLDELYIDTKNAAEESGDIIIPVQEGWVNKNQVKDFGQIFETLNAPNTDVKTTLFKSVGMSLFDLIVAETIYEKAIKLNLGQHIEA